MNIGVARITLRIPHSHSLKDKRRVANSLRQRVGSKFNASIAEVEMNDAMADPDAGHRVCIQQRGPRVADDRQGCRVHRVRTPGRRGGGTARCGRHQVLGSYPNVPQVLFEKNPSHARRKQAITSHTQSDCAVSCFRCPDDNANARGSDTAGPGGACGDVSGGHSMGHRSSAHRGHRARRHRAADNGRRRIRHWRRSLRVFPSPWPTS